MRRLILLMILFTINVKGRIHLLAIMVKEFLLRSLQERESVELFMNEIQILQRRENLLRKGLEVIKQIVASLFVLLIIEEDLVFMRECSLMAYKSRIETILNSIRQCRIRLLNVSIEILLVETVLDDSLIQLYANSPGGLYTKRAFPKESKMLETAWIAK